MAVYNRVSWTVCCESRSAMRCYAPASCGTAVAPQLSRRRRIVARDCQIRSSVFFVCSPSVPPTLGCVCGNRDLDLYSLAARVFVKLEWASSTGCMKDWMAVAAIRRPKRTDGCARGDPVVRFDRRHAVLCFRYDTATCPLSMASATPLSSSFTASCRPAARASS